jgi:hypothetical protein
MDVEGRCVTIADVQGLVIMSTLIGRRRQGLSPMFAALFCRSFVNCVRAP